MSLKKTKLSRVATLTGSTLQKNVTIIAFDTSFHSTGIAIVRTTDEYLILEETAKLVVKDDVDILKGLDIFVDQLERYKETIVSKYNIDFCIIEDTFFGNNILVLKNLVRFGTLVYDRMRKIVSKTYLIMPSTARKDVGFKKTAKGVTGPKLKKEIMKYVSELLEHEIYDNDIADAIVLAISGLTPD